MRRHLFDDSTKRLIDIFLPSRDSGRDLNVGVSVVSSFGSVGLDQIRGAAARTTEQRKTYKYESRREDRNLLFMHLL